MLNFFFKKRSLSLVETIFLSIFFHAIFLSYVPSLTIKDTFQPMELDIDILISESQQEKKFEPISEIKPIKKIEALDPIQTMEAPKPEPMIKPKEVRQPEEISQPKIENNLAPSVMKRTIESYSSILAKAIAKHKKYPRIAQMRGWQGEIIINLEIDGQGNLIMSKIKNSSKHEILNREGMNMIKRASPFPKPPKELASKIFNVIVPISFKLQEQ